MDMRAASGKERDGELKMRQCLLILGLLSTLCGFHYEFGDPRLLEDLVQREEEAWFPRVGTEDYEKFQDARTGHSISWKAFTSDFVSTFPHALPRGPERPEPLQRLEDQLRSQLRHNLQRMGQLEDWPRKLSPTPLRQFACKDFTWEMDVWLVLYSSALIPFGGRSSSEMWKTQNRDSKQLADFLGTSCLFSKPLIAKRLTTKQLKDYISKLELLFYGPGKENNSTLSELIYVVAFYVCDRNDDAFIEHFRNLPYLSTLCKDPSSEPGKWLYRCILEQNGSTVTEDDLIINEQRPIYCRPFDSLTLARLCWKDIVGKSQDLLDHRCLRPILSARSDLAPDDPDAIKEVE